MQQLTPNTISAPANTRRWLAKAAPDPQVLEQLRQQLKTSEILLKLIAQRNISTLEEAHMFFQPALDKLHSPFLMKDMDKAVARLKKAIEGGEHIVVYGDYDVDGTTAVALMYSFLRKIYDRLSFYIPDRFKEGYGISYAGVDWISEQGGTLVIALDCGIKSVDHIAYAAEKGIDFIICDHHTVGERVPQATAILNPKQSDCNYPYKELSGCGIGYKFAEAYASYIGMDWDPKDYLDLVAISISADIVHMTGENRIMTFHGLRCINEAPRPGVQALIDLAGLKKGLTVNDLVFRIGPRINAAGRISSGSLAVNMLIEPSVTTAYDTAQAINKNNTDRQGVDQTITQQALAMIESGGMEERKSTVLFDPEWHKGVIGIVASRLIEKYYRPTVLLTLSNGQAVGSARSVPGFDLYNAIKHCHDLLDQWGGHQAAAGLTMPVENVEAFRAKFEEAVALSITDELLTPVQEYDLELDLKNITVTFCRSIERFGPFGPENMKPVFITRGVRGMYVRIVGNNHLQFTVLSEDGVMHRAIAFGMGELMNEVSGRMFDICYTVEPNEFRGEYQVSLNIKDIQFYH